ncbi:hypothetical protein B0H19DRAFT_1383097 [Mycena capillaripes]|nr:hypothetical protein B0H19DRAFT_1383097 [Mycena capillaripes]
MTRPYSVENILGTYWRIGEENPGFLTLGLRAGVSATWENVYGVFQALNDSTRGAFNGLMSYEAAVAASGSPPRPTLRRFDLVTSYEWRVPLQGHAFEVLDAVDDNGNNYIAMMLEYCIPGSNCVSFMGKKELREGRGLD